MIAPNSRASKGGKQRGEVKWEYGGIRGEEEGNAVMLAFVIIEMLPVVVKIQKSRSTFLQTNDVQVISSRINIFALIYKHFNKSYSIAC